MSFDENIYLFSKLHPTAGARLREEISLLPSYLHSSPDHSDVCIANIDSVLISDSNPVDEHAAQHLLDARELENSEEIRQNNEEIGSNAGIPYHFMQGESGLVDSVSALDHAPNQGAAGDSAVQQDLALNHPQV
jgi:hypothetical protein